jgi:hypothetical protein
MMTPMQIREEMNREMGKHSLYGMGEWFSWLPTATGAKRVSKHLGSHKHSRPVPKAKRKMQARDRARNRRVH